MSSWTFSPRTLIHHITPSIVVVNTQCISSVYGANRRRICHIFSSEELTINVDLQSGYALQGWDTSIVMILLIYMFLHALHTAIIPKCRCKSGGYRSVYKLTGLKFGHATVRSRPRPGQSALDSKRVLVVLTQNIFCHVNTSSFGGGVCQLACRQKINSAKKIPTYSNIVYFQTVHFLIRQIRFNSMQLLPRTIKSRQLKTIVCTCSEVNVL